MYTCLEGKQRIPWEESLPDFPCPDGSARAPFLMRVLLMTESYPTPNHPGRGIFLQSQVEALAKAHSIEVLFPKPFFPGVPSAWLEVRARTRDAVLRERASVGIPVFRPSYFYVPRQRSIRTKTLSVLLERFLRGSRVPYDLIHAHWLAPAGLAAVRVGRRFGMPVVVTAHAGDVYRDLDHPAYARMAAETVRSADRLIAVADYFRDPLLRLGAPAERLEVIPNGVDTEIFAPADQEAARASLDLPQGVPLYLYIGNLEVAKGVVDLVETFLTAVPEPSVLVVAGTGRLAPWIASRAGASPGRMIVRGLQSHPGVARYLAAADCFILPSYAEGNPVTILESLCSGRPVVGSAIPAITALVSTGVNGLLCPPGDRSALATALRDVIRQQWDCKKIARDASAKYGWGEVTMRISAVYQKVTSRSDPEVARHAGFRGVRP